MNQCKRIFIVGQHGAGKGLVAKTLAEKLGWEFIDADLGLESKIGRTMIEIVGEAGEEKFHLCESEILSHQLKKENIVVTTDSGIILNEKNRQLLSSEFVVYLKVTTPVQIGRTSHQSAPPLLTTNRKDFFDKLHIERDGLYEAVASMSIDSDDNELEAHVLSIIRTVSNSEEIQQEPINLKPNKKDLIFFHKNLHTPIHLTEQQAMCLKFLSQGKSAKEIAKSMSISYRTVEGNIAKTMELLGCSSSKELIALYHEKP